jgi:phosphoserine phosphatase
MIIVIDICDTLFLQNTTFGFIDFIKNENKSFYKKIKIPLIIIGKLFKVDFYRNRYLNNLKGYSKEQLYTLANQYYDNVLSCKKNHPIHQIIEQNKNNKIILCSASLDIIVEVIANRLGVNTYYSSELLFDGDLCTGKLKTDLLGKKHLLFNYPIDWVITDNLSDIDLVKKASKYTIVSKKKDLAFWYHHGIDVSIIL